MKKKVRRMISAVLAVVMLCGIIPANATVSKAATTANVSLSSLGRKGTVSFGSKAKSGKWWKMRLGSKEAFCLSLGHTCHSGNTYAAENSYKWDQDTGGEKHGYYAKIIRWYVLNGKRTQKSFVMSQALIWSVSEGRNSEAQLKDAIKQVKDNTHTYSSKTVNELYSNIFEPSGNWEVTATIWQKTGNSKSYQKLITVDAEKLPQIYTPTTLTDTTYYRQRITVKKKDEDGNGLGGIQFTLDADNLDDLYSFSVSDRDGLESSSADDDNETSFSLTGYTKDSGRLAYRMTYRLQTMDYYYYTDSDLADMDSDAKKAAKKFLTDDLELDEGIDFPSDLTKASAQKMAAQEIKDLMDNISNTYTLTENNTGENKHLIVDPTYAKGVRITLDKDDSWQKDSSGAWPESDDEIPSDYEKAYITGVTNNYKKASSNVIKADQYSADKKAHGDASLEGAQFQLYADRRNTSGNSAYGAELDSLTGRIAKQLYPKANITVDGFEKTGYPNDFFDVVIGNVPFGQYKVPDKKYDKQNFGGTGFLIHDYFFAKAIDQVRPGGLIAFITSKGTMDKENPKVRKYIAQRAELLGAVRLPNTAFKENAGTEVTSDIIFLKKRDRVIDIEPDWVHLSEDDNGIVMNHYFTENPDMIVGSMEMVSGPYGMESTCVRSCEDVDEAALTYAEVKALATGNPYIKEKMDLDIQVSKLKLMKANHTSQIYRLEDNIAKHYPKQIETLKERIRGFEADIETAHKHMPEDKESFVMKVGSRTYYDKKEAGTALIALCKQMNAMGQTVPVGEYAGFAMKVTFDSFNRKFVMSLKGEISHNLEIGSDALGNITRINNVLENMDKELAEARTKLENVSHQLETAKIEVQKPFPAEQELKEKMERLAALDALLNMDEKGEDVVLDEEPKVMPLGEWMVEHLMPEFMEENEITEERARELLADMVSEEEDEIVCFSTELNGASLDDEEMLKQMAEYMDGDYYAIPISESDYLIAPKTEQDTVVYLQAVLGRLGSSILTSEAVTTHAAYEYDSSLQTMKPFNHVGILQGLMAVGEEKMTYHTETFREEAKKEKKH